MPFVLIVDDDLHIAVALRELLKCQGFDAVGAADGAAALERMRHGDVDVVLLDMRMPRMDGRAFLAARREDAALLAIPVIVLTGLEPTVEPDVFATLHKPADPDTIIDTVRRAKASRKQLAAT